MPRTQRAPIHIQNASLLSFDSATPTPSRSESTISDVTSSSTIWGPGALTGKALVAFGEATLRGVELVVMRRRLHVLRQHFPEYADTPSPEMVQMYGDVLELTRYDGCASFLLALTVIQLARTATRTAFGEEHFELLSSRFLRTIPIRSFRRY